MDILRDIGFWIVAGVATLIKVLSSPYHSFLRSLVMVVSGVFVAVVFTGPLILWLRLNPDIFLLPTCALLTLTGEGIVRFVISMSMNPDDLADWLRRVIRRPGNGNGSGK